MSSESLPTLKSSALGCEHFSADIYFFTSISAVIWVVLTESRLIFFLSFFFNAENLCLYFQQCIEIHLGNFFLLPSCTFPTNLQNEGKFTTSSRYNINSSSKNKLHKPNKSKHFKEVEYFRMDEVSLCGRRQSPITQGKRRFALGHCCCCESYPGFHGTLAAEVAVWSLSLISCPRGHHPSASPPAHSRHPGLPQEPRITTLLLPAVKTALMFCAHLCTVIIPCDTTLWSWSQQSGLSYKDCNNASF